MGTKSYDDNGTGTPTRVAEQAGTYFTLSGPNPFDQTQSLLDAVDMLGRVSHQGESDREEGAVDAAVVEAA